MADLSAAYGLVLDPWQEQVLQAGMGERSDGRWAARQVACSAPRQQGKTQIIVARVLAGLLLFDEQVIIVSAHRQDTARETFSRLVQIIEDNPDLDDRVDFIAKSEMREYIRLKTGQEVRFKSRATGAGRGFSFDCLLLDEAQDLGAAAWSSILPTMSARPNPQVWLFGTPPTPDDDPEVFSRLRTAGIAGKESRLAYLEWAAEPLDDLDDAATWAKANPAFGTRIDYEAVAAERASMSDEQFRRERLGIWDEDDVAERPIPVDDWKKLEIPDDQVPDDAPTRYAVAMTPERMASIAVGVPGERAYLDLAEMARVDDSRLLVDWLVKRKGRRVVVMIDSRDPAASLVPELRAHGVQVNATTQQDAGKACGGLLDAVSEARVSHCGQPALESALRAARKKLIGKAGLWEWDLEDPTSEAACLRAVTLAHYGLLFEKPRASSSGRAVGRMAGRRTVGRR